MANRTKKNVKDFKQALLSNTEFIKQEDPVSAPKEQDNLLINDDVLEKLKLLSEYEGVSLEDTVNKALNHFLRLKGVQLDQALKAKQ